MERKQISSDKTNLVILLLFLIVTGFVFLTLMVNRLYELNPVYLLRLNWIILCILLCLLVAFVGEILDRDRGVIYK
jgi:uncharacterized membrane protein YoaK (UPF0700 family)